jgi:hypothetical protein
MQMTTPTKKAGTLVRVLTFFAVCIGFFLTASAAEARNYYISPQGNNTTGLSWATAYTSMPNLIAGESPVAPGDVIILDGGSGSAGINYGMITQMTVNGTSAKPITITSSLDSGHDGPVYFNGYSKGQNQAIGVSLYGSYINFTGAKRDGIIITNFQYFGLVAAGNGINVNNVEISNVVPLYSGTGVGLAYTGTNYQFLNLDILGSTECVQEYPISGAQSATFNGCWFFDTTSRNYTGITTYDNNAGSVLTVKNCVFGPGLGNGFMSTASAGQTNMTGCLFLNSSGTNVFLNPSIGGSAKFNINQITSFMTPSNYQGLANTCIAFNSYGSLTVDNSVFWGGDVGIATGIKVNVSGNYQYKTKVNTQVLASTETDPQFENETKLAALTGKSPLKTFATEDYEIAKSSPAYGKGAAVVEVKQLNKNVGSFFK